MLSTSPGLCQESRQSLNEPQHAGECQVGIALPQVSKYTLLFEEIKDFKMRS